MEIQGVPKFYEPSQTPVLYVGPVSNVRGRVPLTPRQLHTDHPTRAPSPKGQEILTLLCRRLQRVRQEGSNVHQLNQWLWEFGRGKPRLGGLSAAETEARRLGIAVMQDGAKRGRHTTRVRRSHKAPKAAAAQ